MTTAFFYGVLIHPKILKRVLSNDASHLQICPAILKGYARHRVKSEDYPAIIPGERSKTIFGRELTAEENSVRGTLVTGLTADDLTFLDVFESDLYERLQVRVHALGPFAPFPADTTGTPEVVEDSFLPTNTPQSLATVSELAELVEAQTYVWCLEDNKLDKELWSFDEFMSKNSWRWLGKGAQDNEDYAEVDIVRERFSRKAGTDGG